MKLHRFFPRTFLILLLFPGVALLAHGDDNPAVWKHQVKGEFATVLADLKAGLEARQFQISGEEDMSQGLRNNIAVFGEDKWNTIGFDNVVVVHFCSLVFNQEVYNLDMNLAILCPFKAVVYNMQADPGQVTIMTVRPGYLVAKESKPESREIGKRIEEEILSAIQDSLR